jgi:hypothetical protein
MRVLVFLFLIIASVLMQVQCGGDSQPSIGIPPSSTASPTRLTTTITVPTVSSTTEPPSTTTTTTVATQAQDTTIPY